MAKFSISVAEPTAVSLRELAERLHAGNVSALVGDLVNREARRVASADAVTEWEAEHGEITEQELTAARTRWLA